MIDKQAGNLEIDVFSGGKYAVTMNGKSSERKNRLEEMPHPDFISYLKDREELLKTLKDILAMNLKEDFQIEEIEDYIFVVNEYHKEVRIEDLNKKLKEEKDPLKQAKISEEIMKIRGGIRNGIRN